MEPGVGAAEEEEVEDGEGGGRGSRRFSFKLEFKKITRAELLPRRNTPLLLAEINIRKQGTTLTSPLRFKGIIHRLICCLAKN